MNVLGVKESLSGKEWLYKDIDEKKVARLMQLCSFPEVFARILVARQVDENELDAFLYPTLKRDLPNPLSLRDVAKTAERFTKEIVSGRPIGIMGDYDVDGATSSALLRLFLESVGVSVSVFIPDREDGYGPNITKMQEFYKQGIRLVATVDCGMTAFEPIDFGTKLGLDVIIIDHHEPEKELPNAYAVVNPKRLDEDENHSCRALAAVGVVFLVVVAINSLLRKQGFYQGKIKEPDLKKWLDLVAFGTICDVVPLTKTNRLLVKSGLKYMLQNNNLGLQVLSQLADIKEQITAYHLGYILGPRVNAGGRVGTSDLGMRLLSTNDKVEAMHIAHQLEDLNILRRQIEAQVLEQALLQAQSCVDKKRPFVLVKGENWHQGVVGIVAGRLKEKFNLPSFVLSIEGNEAKGSSRSIKGVDLGCLVITALQKGILLRGGGHPMAAGFSLCTKDIETFEAFLQEYILTHCRPDTNANKEILVDGILDISGANINLLKQLSILEPYGERNEEPEFAIQEVSLKKTIITQNGHIICKFCGKDGTCLDGVCFRAQGTTIGETLLSNKPGQYYHLIGQLRLDTWNNRQKVQLIIHDIALAK